jgi:elongation factor P hydroxylase
VKSSELRGCEQASQTTALEAFCNVQTEHSHCGCEDGMGCAAATGIAAVKVRPQAPQRTFCCGAPVRWHWSSEEQEGHFTWKDILCFYLSAMCDDRAAAKHRGLPVLFAAQKSRTRSPPRNSYM